jgi:TRAP-type mannitol/chloroaromatic compound transport system permease small subunit
MLSTVGDILNWLAAGVLFPLMLLPLATLSFRGGGWPSAIGWLLIIAAVAGAGVLFAALAPRLGVDGIGAKAVPFALILVALCIIIALVGGTQRAATVLARAFGPLVRATGRTVMWFVAVMALVQFAVVILRYVFGLNFIFMQESITYLHGAVFLLAAGYALLTDDQVRVDILYRSASPRRRALVDFAGTYLFLFPICLLILWTSDAYVGNSWAVREGSNEQSGIQGVFILKSMIPAFAVLLAMAGFVRAAEAGAVLRGER